MCDFDKLMQAEILRDELLSECQELMAKLDDQKLASVRTVIQSLGALS